MNTKNETRAILIKGSGAATAAMLATMLCDKRENGESWRAINAVSHMIYGDEAKAQRSFSARHTLPALAMNFAAISGWALCHRAGMWALQQRDENIIASTRTSKKRALSLGFAISAMAYVIDFHVVPPKLRPGIETQISRRALFFVYLTLALSLASFGENDKV